MVNQPDKKDFKVTAMPPNPVGNAVYYVKPLDEDNIVINVTDDDGVAYPIARGQSAYEAAVAGGFVGTEAEWLASLHGTNGTNGTNGATGPQGPPGADGDAGTVAADLASTTDAAKGTALVGWLSPATGAYGRTLSSKLREIIHVKDFDASLDGSSDDTGPINDALAAAYAAGVATVEFSGGVGSIVSSSIIMQPGVTLRGNGVSYIKRANSSTFNVIVDCGSAHGSGLVGMVIDGNRANVAANLNAANVNINTANDVLIDGCHILNSNGYGLTGAGQRIKLKRSKIDDSYLIGAYFNGGGDGFHDITQNVFSRNNRGQLNIGHNSFTNIYSNKFVGHLIGQNGGMTINCSGATVTSASGTNFATVVPGMSLILATGQEYHVTAKASDTSMTVDPAPGTLSGVAAVIGTADGVGINTSSYCNFNDNIVMYAASFGVGVAAGGDAYWAAFNKFSNNIIAHTGKTGMVALWESGTGVVLANSITGNTFYNCGSGSSGDLDSSAIVVYSGTLDKVLQTQISGNIVSAPSGTGQTKYMLGIGPNSSPGSVRVESNSTFNVVNGDAIYNAGNAVAITNSAASPGLVINGHFLINQRSFAGGALSAGIYGHDRWKADTGGANYSVSGATVTIASGTIVQVIEAAAFAVAGWASQLMTVSVEDPSASVTVTLGSQSGTILAGAGRRSVTVTLGAGDTGNLSLKLGGAASFSRVKCEVGGVATPWHYPSEDATFDACARYCFVVGLAGGGRYFSPSAYNDGGQFSFPVPMHKKMRAVPTMSLVGTAGTDYYVSVNTTPVAGFSFGFQTESKDSFIIYGTKAAHGITLDINVSLCLTAAGGIIATAEL